MDVSIPTCAIFTTARMYFTRGAFSSGEMESCCNKLLDFGVVRQSEDTAIRCIVSRFYIGRAKVRAGESVCLFIQHSNFAEKKELDGWWRERGLTGNRNRMRGISDRRQSSNKAPI